MLCIFLLHIVWVCVHACTPIFGYVYTRCIACCVVHYKEYKRHSVVNFKEYLIIF